MSHIITATAVISPIKQALETLPGHLSHYQLNK